MAFFPVPLLPKPSLKTLASIYGARNLLTKTPVDVVKIALDSNPSAQVFTAARAMKVNLMPSSKLMDHPIEDGSLQTDFRILNPLELELSVICTGKNWKTVYNQINTGYLNGELYTITTKSGVYPHMMMQAIPHDETPDMFDVLAVSIKFREVVLAVTNYTALPANQVKNTNDQSTTKTGTPTAKTPPASILSQAASYVSGAVTSAVNSVKGAFGIGQ